MPYSLLKKFKSIQIFHIDIRDNELIIIPQDKFERLFAVHSDVDYRVVFEQ